MATITAAPAVLGSHRAVRSAGSARPARATATAPRAAATKPQVRLTRRGRLVGAAALVLAVAALLLGAMAVLLGPMATPAAAGAAASHPAAATYVVQPGQTLWAIATAIAPNADPRETITTLREANNLTTSDVYAGQRLVIPALN